MRDTTLIKIQNWFTVFKDKKESGLTVPEYCKQNNITRDAYYYWLRRCRNYIKETEQGQVIFAELKPPLPLDNTYVKQDMSLINEPEKKEIAPYDRTTFTYPPEYFDAQIRLSINKINIDIKEGTSLKLIKDIVEVLNNATGSGK